MSSVVPSGVAGPHLVSNSTSGIDCGAGVSRQAKLNNRRGPGYLLMEARPTKHSINRDAQRTYLRTTVCCVQCKHPRCVRHFMVTMIVSYCRPITATIFSLTVFMPSFYLFCSLFKQEFRRLASGHCLVTYACVEDTAA